MNYDSEIGGQITQRWHEGRREYAVQAASARGHKGRKSPGHSSHQKRKVCSSGIQSGLSVCACCMSLLNLLVIEDVPGTVKNVCRQNFAGKILVSYTHTHTHTHTTLSHSNTNV